MNNAGIWGKWVVIEFADNCDRCPTILRRGEDAVYLSSSRMLCADCAKRVIAAHQIRIEGEKKGGQ